MAITKKGRKRISKRSNKPRAGRGRKSMMIPKYKIPHYHVRWAELDRTIDLAGTSSYVNSAYSFKLEDLQNFSELGVLYDNYKITKVVLYVNWSPFAYSTGMNNDDKTPDLVAPLLMYRRDHDDSNVMTLADFKQCGDTKQFRLRPGKQYKIAITPSILTEAFRTGVTQAYKPVYNQKLDMAYTDVNHYGIKFGISKAPIALGQVNIRAKYYVTCYTPR